MNLFVERIILGRFTPVGREIGSDAAVVSVAYGVVAVILMLAMGVTVYCALRLSERIGSGRDELVGSTFW